MSPRNSSKNNVLLTGATGMVGCHLLVKLVQQGHAVGLLVRPGDQVSAVERVTEVLRRFDFDWDESDDRIRVMAGSLNEPSLGLNASDQRWAKQHVNRVLHCAASLSFRPASESPDNEPYRTNVQGTQNLLSVSADWDLQSFHYVSTAYVCGDRRGVVLEGDSNVGQGFANDYEQSKSQSEALVRSVDRCPVTIYRPSIVIDSMGRSPVARDRTIYGAYQTYQALASKFGLPENGGWFRSLGFRGDERKNLIEADWVADAIVALFGDSDSWGRTYHLTAPRGTSVEDLEAAFREAFLASGSVNATQSGDRAAEASAVFQTMAAPYVKTFLPYFNDDPVFDAYNVNQALARLNVSPAQDVCAGTIAALVEPDAFGRDAQLSNSKLADDADHDDDIVVVGYDVALPGGAESADAFEKALFENRSVIDEVPEERFDRSLYYDSKRGEVGKSYTTMGGCVGTTAINPDVAKQAAGWGDFDECHVKFASVVASAWKRAGIPVGSNLANDCGIYVGHSGGTKDGGPLAMATLTDAAMESASDLASPAVRVSPRTIQSVTDGVRKHRPHRRAGRGTHFNAYSAASLAARVMGLRGIREVIDAACASSLVALRHACIAIKNQRIEAAVVGGATYNNVDNLILFSQSQACRTSGSSPFDENASGLVSSEGYVAVVVMRRSVAKSMDLDVIATIESVGVATDGRGKSLWAPRTEGQQLAIRRAYKDGAVPLDIDYMECHATSTQVGDATELNSLTSLRSEASHDSGKPLLIGSAKSNLGHTLEAAGLVGLVKVLMAMKRGMVPASIQFRNPTSHFDWTGGQVRIASRNEHWPESPDGRKKLAAVNAFGIGGLNAHAIVSEESTTNVGHNGRTRSATDLSAGNPSKADDPIAVVGRGVVLPGVFSIDEFASLLRSGQSNLSSPPRGRWRGKICVDPATGDRNARAPFRTPHCVGGYIQGYSFNGQPYRIPPKQVRLANPVQMMLIDAVRQALDEIGEPRDFSVAPGEGVIDRSRTSVVVGTIFGGEFSNQLQVGMRLPELCERFAAELAAEGFDPTTIDAWTTQYRQQMLDQYSALLDETGSFTASTLASRIAKTFDLMGGACAIDADDASGMLAIMTAVDQLRSGDVDTVICGVAQRSLDLVAYEQLNLRGQLVSSGLADDVPDDCSQVIPGEGVAVLILQRADDAATTKLAPKAVIGDIRTTFSDYAEQTKREILGRDSANARLIRQVGYLSGAHSLVRLIAQTCQWSSDNATSHDVFDVAAVAEDGFTIAASVASQQTNSRSNVRPTVIRPITPSDAATNDVSKRVSKPASMTPADFSLTTVVHRAQSPTELVQQLTRWKAAFNIGQRRDRVDVGQGSYVAAFVGNGDARVETQVDELIAALNAGATCQVLDSATGFIWNDNTSNHRVGWLFPGQGSQYSGVPAVFDADALAKQSLNDVDSTLASLGLETIGDRLSDPDGSLGKDIWWTQLWILAVSHAMAEGLRRGGVRCDVASGHSFGECGAALHAGAMDLSQAICFARQRSDAVLTSVRESGQLLSIRGSASRVAAVLRDADSPVVITHHNAPEQTVVAGTQQEIAAGKKTLASAGLASVVIPVPAAFHTPMMNGAEAILRNTFSTQQLRPPACGLLSAVSLRYLAEPNEIRENLTGQLTRPVLFSAAVERMVADGCGLVVEVGPSNVLTRLTRSIAGQNALSVSLDAGIDHDSQLALIQLASEVVSGSSAIPSVRNLSTPFTPTNGRPTESLVSAVSPAQPAVLDVTTSRTNGRVAASSPSRNNLLPETPAAPRPVTKPTSTPVVAQTSIDPSSTNAGHIQSFLVDLVVELTGYSPDVIDFDADLEAELGIDSIKKAQVIGELAEWASIELDLAKMKLSDYGSLADIAALHPGSVNAGAVAIAASTATSSVAAVPRSPVVVESAVHSDASASIVNGAIASPIESALPTLASSTLNIAESMESLMIDFVVDQTGYSVDVVDMDADLEAELGLDSIKKAQLLGELQEQFDLSGIQLGQIKLADFATLRSIQTFVLGQLDLEVVDEKKNKQKDKASLAGDSSPTPVPSRGTCRFVLRTVPAERLPGVPTSPEFSGSAIVLGHNSLADAVERRLRRDFVSVHRPPRLSTVEQVDTWLDTIWATEETPHLFITTPRDEDALGDLDSNAWIARRDLALTVPFRFCQQWMQRMIDVDRMGDATLVSVLNAGGEFGFDADKNDSQQSMPTPESGGIAGLTKAMLIEAWMRGYRETPMLVVDGGRNADDDSIVDGVWRELAVPSYDEEVVVDGVSRRTIDADYAPLDTGLEPNANITRGGAWVVSGGGRGITALTAGTLAAQYNLSLHLLGTAPEPNLDEATRSAAAADRSELRRQVMRAAQIEKRNPIETWRDLEKAIEIDQTLQDFASKGIRAKYYCVNVADADQVRQVCDLIRQQDGPIRGVVHGAGAGQDARFDRKRPDKVAKCIGAKVDGCIHLANATSNDPLEWFVGFGSISGRFGANGHTDYSLANDMLAKCIDRLKVARPDVHCLTFHWHAWGDIGMAAKPEAKLALEMIGMEFMPADEGLAHFMNEFNHGGDRSEVLITDRRYVRKFFPGREVDSETRNSWPILDPSESGLEPAESYSVTLDPVRDRFLAQHLVGGRPTLPMVVALEMMAEAAQRASDAELAVCRNVRALQALKFNVDDAMAVEIVRDTSSDSTDGARGWCLQADLRRRDGRLVEEGRRYFEASFSHGDRDGIRPTTSEGLVSLTELTWESIDYLPPDAPIHHGESLQCLRSIHVDPGNRIIGCIAAPSPAHLGGENRPLSGWQIPCAAMDACLYAAAVLAYRTSGRPSLPVEFEEIKLGRIPKPGEPLQIHWSPASSDEAGMVLDGCLLGVNGDVLMRFSGYRVGWLR